MTEKKRLSAMDTAMLLMETKRTPMHIGCLIVFKLPAKNSAQRLSEIVDLMRNQPFLPAPFDSKLADGALSNVRPSWVKTEVDLEYHVRHSALPKPGTQRELGVLVSRLHSVQLDFDRALWEAHIIEGVEGRRFAIYFKAHHACIDGMGGMAMAKAWLKTTAEDLSVPGMPLEIPQAPTPPQLQEKITRRLSKLKSTAKGLVDMAGGLGRMSRSDDNMIKATLKTGKSLFNVPITQLNVSNASMHRQPSVKPTSKP